MFYSEMLRVLLQGLKYSVEVFGVFLFFVFLILKKCEMVYNSLRHKASL